MNYKYLKNKYIKEVHKKFKENYKIDLGPGSSNKYIEFKYAYNNYLGAILAFISIKMNLSANFITYTNIFFAVIGFLIFFLDIENYKYLGLIIFFSKNILDNVDGFIARYKNETSKYGDKLDFYSALFYYSAVLLSLAFNNYYISDQVVILTMSILILILDFLNPIKLFKSKKNIKKLKNKIYSNIFYKLLRFINYDGRTSVTDLIIFIILIEIISGKFILSTTIISLFLCFKIARNFYYIYKKLKFKW